MTAASYRAVLFGLPIPQQSSSVVGTVAQNELAVKGSWDDGTALAWAAAMGQGSRVRHPLQATQITLTTLQTPFPFPDSIRRPGLGSPWSPARHNKLAGRWVAQASQASSQASAVRGQAFAVPGLARRPPPAVAAPGARYPGRRVCCGR